jgi:outer membrane receptor protein involved in Fe transport
MSAASFRTTCFLSAASAAICLGLAPVAAAQQASDETARQNPETRTEETITSAETIVVLGEITYRNRSDAVEPVLEYGQDFFQRFEPLTAGDALKRVPSVTFLSDVIESDGARLRGLDPGYTQILINGEKVPGSNVDRSFFMDRIPAELIDRVELVRSSSARRSGDAMAGTINIVLRDGLNLEGGYVRAGALRFDDGEFKESLGAVWGGKAGPGRLLLGANLQGRYNPKMKSSLRYGDSPENNPSFATDDFENREDQRDTRDGRDYSLNGVYSVETADGSEFEISGYYVKTDRTEDERSYEYNSTTAVSGSVRATPPGALLSDNANVSEIDQTNYTLSTRYETEAFGGETLFKFGFSSFDEHVDEVEEEIDFNRTTPRFTGDFETRDITDEETSAGVEHEFDLGEDVEAEIGLFWQDKDRNSLIQPATRNRFNLTTAVHSWNQFSSNPNQYRIAYTTPVIAPVQVSEERLDAFALVSGESKSLSWEAGLRYETTDTTYASYSYLLPSAHLKYDLTAVDRLTASAARTVRRPNFDFIAPVLLEAELGDNDLLGNPNLKPESAWGADLGYERRIGKTGVVGVNVFYRAVTDLIEVANTLTVGSEGPGTFVFQPRNTGDGNVYGVEFDLSTPLTAFGLETTGVFLNASWLDSEVDDIFGSRRFNDQSNFVYNAGFIHDMPALQAAFGATYRKQGDAFGRVVAEEITTSYGADLELFVEKRIGERFTVRLVGSNLLNSSKDEVFNKFDTVEDQIDRSFDEYELESEVAGPVIQLIGRYAF